jgi:hypothetical protein
MVHIVPSLSFLKSFKVQLENGQSVSTALETTLQKENSTFSQRVQLWRLHQQNGHDLCEELFHSHYQIHLISILSRGLKGAPIHEDLVFLEVEIEEEFERQWKAYLESLPMKLSLPLLLFFFPSYVVLLFGPLITQFLQEVS